MRLLSVLLAGLVGGIAPAIRVDAGAQPKPPPQISVRVDLVSLDVEVLDPQGEPVSGLQRDDFAVREDGLPRAVSSFAWVSGQPVSLTAILDTSSVTPDNLTIAREHIVLLAHLLAREDEVCLFSFDYRDAYLECDFTSDRTLLVEALENIGVTQRKKRSHLGSLFGNPPRSGLGIDAALQNASRGRNRRKALILVTNRLSGLGPATLDHLRESGLPAYLLSIAGGDSDRTSADHGDSSQRQILRESGGREFLADGASMIPVCRSIAYALKNHYTMTYSTEIGSPDRVPRRIEVLVPGKDYVIHVRRSYAPAP